MDIRFTSGSRPTAGLALALIVTASLCGGDVNAPEVTPTPECSYVIRVDSDTDLDLHTHNFTQFKGQPHYCVLQITADRNLLIVLDLVYSPTRHAGSSTRSDCDSDYLHVGNEVGRVDVNLMTSYKFCAENARHELVSKSNHFWVVLKASRRPREFVLKARAQAPVTCSTDQFPCSPVSCVSRDVICDGFKDCRNGHDEFCHVVDMSQNADVSPDPCFRCGDGTCIQPRLLRSDVSYGRALWYLCDGFSHCADASDERKDVCWSLKNGRVGAVTECVPSDLQFGHNGSIFMWNDIRCDDNNDCFHGDDERNCDEDEGSKLRADPATLGAVAAVLVTACLAVCVTYKLTFPHMYPSHPPLPPSEMAMKNSSRPSTSSTVDTKCTQCSSGDSEPPDVAITLCPTSVGGDFPSLDEGDKDEENSPVLTLRHTVV